MGRYFEYASSEVPVRDDIAEAHRHAWGHLASAGCWFSGAERIALAAEARNARRCPLCEERKQALSPASVVGPHRGLGALDERVIDVVHRVTTDPGRLTQRWFEEVMASAGERFSDAHYVELIGAVTTLVSVDAFHAALGLPPEPLPEPRPGEPSRRRPPGAAPGGAWVPMLPFRQPGGTEADLWKGGTGNVIRALSLVPDEVRNGKRLMAAHYLPPRQLTDLGAGRSLSRAQMELVAGRVSALNECFY